MVTSGLFLERKERCWVIGVIQKQELIFDRPAFDLLASPVGFVITPSFRVTADVANDDALLTRGGGGGGQGKSSLSDRQYTLYTFIGWFSTERMT